MPVLQLDDQQFPLKAGATRIGAGADADVIVPGYSAVGVEAVIDGGPTPTIRRADDASHVRVNGVLLGAEPTPLMHGDKVEVAGLELRFSDDSKGGATQFVSASDIAALTGGRRAGSARATAASGGRLVSLVDGKEYSVADAGLVFGRDATSDVVVPQNEVSRRHAEIVPGEQGYVLRDTSANGVYVNGERVQGSAKLARADIVRIGSEEFRFYADVLSTTPATSHAAAPATPFAPRSARTAEPQPARPSDLLELDLLPAAEVPRPRLDAPGPLLPFEAPPAAKAAKPLPPAAASTPVSAPKARDPRPVIAVLESLNEGPGKGTRHELHTSLGHIGRGSHNDVRLSDESVSETHAKLQKREDGWYVVDMDSTNGTYVGGSRVIGERRIEGAPDVRFGGMKFRFTPVGTSPVGDLEFKGTRAITAMGRPSALAAEQSAAAAPHPVTPGTPSPVSPAAPVRSAGGVPPWVWVVALLVIAAVAFFVLQGRA